MLSILSASWMEACPRRFEEMGCYPYCRTHAAPPKYDSVFISRGYFSETSFFFAIAAVRESDISRLCTVDV